MIMCSKILNFRTRSFLSSFPLVHIDSSVIENTKPDQWPPIESSPKDPSAFSRRAVVSYWRKYVHEVLVNRLGGLSLPRKSVVRLTDRPDMTSDVYRGRETTIQQQLPERAHHKSKHFFHYCACGPHYCCDQPVWMDRLI